MKLKLSLWIVWIFLAVSQLHAQNLLQNGGFETGKQHWTIEEGSHAVISSESHTGQKALAYQQGGIGQDIDESFAITPGAEYILSGYYKTANSVDGIWMGIVYMDANWNTVGETELSLNPNMLTYQPFLQVSKAPANSRYVTLWTWSDASGEGKTFFDDFTFQKANTDANNHAPEIAKIPAQQNSLAEAVSLQVQASDQDHDTLTYALNGLPEETGIAIDSKTGLISGTAAKAGTYDVTVTVVDSKGAVTHQTFQWKFVPDAHDPCNLLPNGNFDESLNGWDVYAQYILSNDAHSGAKALELHSSGLDQTIYPLDHAIRTFQLNGYYKTAGNIDGAWAGIVFYDKEDHELASQETSLRNAAAYQKFILNATAPENTYAIQVWIWFEAQDNTGKLYMDDLKLIPESCFDYVVPSSLPPHGVSVSKAPQFVVIGFDDNTKAEGIDWAINLFSGKKNPDGTDARVSFYMNTKGLHEEIEDNPANLLAAFKRLKNSGHEIGNHTYGHHSDISGDDWDAFEHTVNTLTRAEWKTKIEKATNDLVNMAEISRDTVVGFRAPYLLYNQNLFEELKSQNFLYDCSIEEGAAENFDGTNFRWPYQLNGGSPGHNESWYGNSDNPNAVTIGAIDGLWELPNHLMMVPKDSECAKYGIKKGLWKRIKKKIPYLEGHKITGFDYNLWSYAKLSKQEVLGILKYNLDLRLKGNRAPFMFGAHTQYYTQSWVDEHNINATYQEMRAAISEFIDYALSKPEVRVVPAKEIIKWCTHPVPLQ